MGEKGESEGLSKRNGKEKAMEREGKKGGEGGSETDTEGEITFSLARPELIHANQNEQGLMWQRRGGQVHRVLSTSSPYNSCFRKSRT